MPRKQFEMPLEALPRLSHFGFSDNVKKYSYGPHYHYGFEMIFVTKGQAEVELFKGKAPVSLRQDDLCIISPGIVHEFIYDRETISFFWLGFQTGHQVAVSPCHMQPPRRLIQKETEHKVEYSTLINKEIDEITANMQTGDYNLYHKVPYFSQIFSDINEELHNRDQYSVKIVYQKILEIFTKIARIATEDKRVENPPLHYFKNYLDSHCTEKVDFQLLSEKTGYSQEHLSRLFKVSYGRSPKSYHNEKRLNKACQILSRGASVDYTARLCGFNSPSYFSVWFKKQTGRPPQKYL
ncbi:MAG: AraC family transcriptional regulator [Spirochaetales bacterium]|nr:AraC family transcriptional regulator [Spirochaetales bacterium]